MADKKEKKPKYILSSALLWAVAMGAYTYATAGVTYTLANIEVWKPALISAGSGLVSGFFAALFLGRVAKFGTKMGLMMVAGLIVGVLVASGAAAGLKYVLLGQAEVNWETLLAFIASNAAAPAAVLGILTGIYVRMRIPQQKKKK
jgi:hypothetical protein